ncbi:MAG: nitrogenase component 1 [Ruminiclostridium sp.]
MGLDGNKMLAKMKRLSEAANMKQVKPLSYALFPGYHCPLMGAMLTIKEIDNSVMVVIGPDECAYYTKLATAGGSMRSSGCEIVSVVLDQHDVTFGCQKKLDEAFSELMEEYTPEAVYLVTTCVVEVTGDDIEAMARVYSEKYGLPVIVVHAENFKTDDHLPGIENTLNVSVDIMEKQHIKDCVNVLGLRLGDFSKTEVCRFLAESGIETAMVLPGETSVNEIRSAPKAKCNIVVHPVGMPLAKEMQKRFGTPYVVFERYSDPERILSCYQQLFAILGKEIPSEIGSLYESSTTQIEQARAVLSGKTYISGNTALCNYELHSFLAERLDIKPLLLQISDLDDDSAEFREKLLKYCDPYVTRAANIAAMQYIYPLLKPDFNIGAGNAAEMRKQGISTVRMMKAYNTLGFEVCGMVVEAFLQADREANMPPVSMNMMKGAMKR